MSCARWKMPMFPSLRGRFSTSTIDSNQSARRAEEGPSAANSCWITARRGERVGPAVVGELPRELVLDRLGAEASAPVAQTAATTLSIGTLSPTAAAAARIGLASVPERRYSRRDGL